MPVAIGYDPALTPDRVQVTTGSGVEFAPHVELQRLTAPPAADGLSGLDFFRGLCLDIDFRSGHIRIDSLRFHSLPRKQPAFPEVRFLGFSANTSR